MKDSQKNLPYTSFNTGHWNMYPQEQKGRTLHSMRRLLIGCMEILILKLAATTFALGLIALPKNTLPMVP